MSANNKYNKLKYCLSLNKVLHYLQQKAQLYFISDKILYVIT